MSLYFQGLDFEQANNFSLLVVVENEVPFAVPLSTSTATVTITVQDVNEPPILEPAEKQIIVHEDVDVGSTIQKYTAKDPDTAREQKIRFYIHSYTKQHNYTGLSYHETPFLCIYPAGM